MSEIDHIDRSVPKKIEPEYLDLLNKGIVALNLGDYKVAEGIFYKQLLLLSDYQKEVKHPIHKGTPLHNMGLSQFFMENIQDALTNFILAYVEDALNTKYEYEDEAERAPAARILRDSFLFDVKILHEIKSRVFCLKKDGKWKESYDPSIVLTYVAKKFRFDLNKLRDLCKNIPKKGKPLVGFPEPRERRVFIGANYDKNQSVISVIKQAVFAKGYTPVIPAEYGINPNNIHDETMTLLHTCGHAIIEITNPAGQYMEVERCHDYKIHTILFIEKPIGHPPYYSAMIDTTGFTVIPYSSHQDLFDKVKQNL